MTKGGLLRWNVKEGSKVESGDTIAEIETDKATMDFDSVDEGIVAKLLVSEGSKEIEVGTPIALFVEDEKDIQQFHDYQSAPVTEESSLHSAPKTDSKKAKHGVKIGPAARKLAVEKGVSLDAIHPTGPKGIIVKQDILNAQSTPSLIKAEAKQSEVTVKKAEAPLKGVQVQDQYKDLPLSQMRSVIARRLLESKTSIPGIYFTTACNLSEIDRLRQTLKASGTKVSVNDFVTRAVALALSRIPAANAYWDVKDQAAKSWSSVDISIAVSTPAGLITPIIKDADKKSIKAIADETRSLAEKARSNKLKPEEFMGGTFTISNLGMYGISHFSAIINPPQGCIMAVGTSRSELRLNQDTHEVESIPMMSVTLTADHRVYDGDIAHQFLQAFQEYMEQPLPLLV